MSYNKISFLFVFFIGIYIQNGKAQALNIIGDTIFVNMEAEIQLVFPTHPKSFNTVPEDNQFLIWDSRTGINLIAASENYDPVTLYVAEAERKHRFVLVYKKGISNKEAKLYYDYSTVKKLSQHIRETTFPKLAGAQKTVVNIGPVKQDDKKNKKEIAVEETVDSLSNYNALLDEGDKDIQLQNYQDARVTFEKAHSIRPDDIIPTQRLEQIKAKLGETETSAQNNNGNKYVNENKYILTTADAKNKMSQKKYADARDAYNKALAIKPGDTYATQQLQKIDVLVADENAQKEKQKNKELNDEVIAKAQTELKNKQLSIEKSYDSAVKSADNLFKSGEYENAKSAYNNALSFIKKDWPKTRINKINKILTAQIAQANEDKKKLALQQIASEQKAKKDSSADPGEVKKKYIAALSNGRSSYLKSDLINAKLFYEEAMNLQPLQQEPKNQLKIINDKLQDSVMAAAIDDKYDKTIELADSLVNSKEFDSAVTIYKQAILIKPLESYPKKQLKYMYSELALIEKRKKEEKEKQYSDALAGADKAVTEKRYDDAKSAYTMALDIHPENEYARRRLEIVSYQVQIALDKLRLQKQSEDSIKQIPVKKIKKKKSQ